MPGMEIGGKTRLLALLGKPVGHSLSPAMHNASFAAEGLDYVYVALDVDPDDVPAAVRGAVALGFRGFNVTMPHKRAMVPLMHELDEAARISGAVNTVRIENMRLCGHNTDGSGLVEACKEAGVALAGREFLLLGAGGAAASIAVALCGEGVGRLRIVNRNVERAEDLSERLRRAGKGVEIATGSAATLEGEVPAAPVIVNATSLGMRDADPLPLQENLIQEDAVVVDAVYRPGRETALIQTARERGASVVTGQRMLLYQGVLAQRLWTGHEPNIEAMAAALA
jgi:shikimate dehydrogenase